MIDYTQNKREYLRRSAEEGAEGPYTALARLETGQQISLEPLIAALEKIDERRDCADFQMAGFIRMLFQFASSPFLPAEIHDRVRRTVLDFKYWPDEPGTDSMCYWSENHYILFSSAGYLSGQLFPDEVFANSGRTGREQQERFRPRVERWLDLRFASGFSEWMSNVYYNEDLPALLNLIDFSADPVIARKGQMVCDLLLMDIALNSYKGTMACSHGRSYENQKKYHSHEATAPLGCLFFENGVFKGGNFSAIFFSLSTKYRVPRIIPQIAKAYAEHPIESRQQCGMAIEKAHEFRLDLDNPADGMLLLTGETYTHYRFIHTFLKLMQAYGWWDNRFFNPLRNYRGLLMFLDRTGLLRPFMRLFHKDSARNYRGNANIYTYRTPDYMMGSAQNYRPGMGGDQQSPWQAGMGDNANVFITHPAKLKTDAENNTPNYWTGSGNLPKVGQHRGVSILLFKISTAPGLYLTHKLRFTHAWFPAGEFDEVQEDGHWLFARKGSGYLGLWSRQKPYWNPKDPDKTDLIAEGKRNVWICQMGRETDFGSFSNFRQELTAAALVCRGLQVSYTAPREGTFTFSWHSPLQVDGKTISQSDYPRYGTPWGDGAYPLQAVRFEKDGDSLELDYPALRREAAALPE